jgi:hypothetical protein
MQTLLNNKIDSFYFTNAHEADPLFSNWNKRDGINIFSKQIIDKESLLEPYAFLTDITDGTIDADFTSVSVNGNIIISFPGFSTLLDDYGFTDNSTLWDNTADSIPILRADIDDINAKLDTIEVFYAASSQTDYTLANNVQEEYTISQNGVILPPSVYSISTNILTINIGVYKNDRIQINYKYVKL